MSREPELWLVIPRWQEFQHYRDRNPVWLKVYTELLHDPDFLSLSGHQRGVLLGLWLEYASSHCRVRVDTAWLSRRLNLKVTWETLNALNHAGFIAFSASKPLASRKQGASLEAEREKEKEKEPPKPPADAGGFEDISFEPRPPNGKVTPGRLRALGLRPRDLHKFTGCRWVKGSHAATHVLDVLGTDRPPPEWPYPRPEPEAVVLALEALQEHEEPSGV